MSSSARRRRGSEDRFEIDNVLDDLLASDDDEVPRIKTPVKKDPPKPAPGRKKIAPQLGVDADFYNDLGPEKEDEESEDEELSDGAVKRLAAEIGDLDDLDNGLFSGLGGSSKEKKVQGKQTSYDFDDPLAGLVFSDDDLDHSANKKKSGKKSLLTRTLSHEKARVEPHSFEPNESDEGKLSQRLENGDPFITSLTSVSSRKVEKQTSDEHLLGISLNSDSDISPRQFTKQKKTKSRRKGSVEPSSVASDADTDLEGSFNFNKSITNDILPEETNTKDNSEKLKRVKKVNRNKDEDLFGNSDGLPGMSDDESPPKNVKRIQGGIGSEKVVPSALDNLLNPSPSKKKQEPTMLEKIMAGKPSSKGEEKSGYSPSVDRPTTAPSNRRSVHFADQLGSDLVPDDTRPISAPEGKKYNGRRKKPELNLDSSFDETTKEWLTLAKTKQESTTDKEKVVKKQKSNDDWLGLGADLTDSFNLESSVRPHTPKREENKPDSLNLESSVRPHTPKREENKQGNENKDKLEGTYVGTKEEKIDDVALLFDSPSHKLGTIPGSRHRTPEKKLIRGESFEETALDVRKDNMLQDQLIEPKAADETQGDGFLNLLKRGKEKKQVKKEESQDIAQPGKVAAVFTNQGSETVESKSHLTGSSSNKAVDDRSEIKVIENKEDPKTLVNGVKTQSNNTTDVQGTLVALLQQLAHQQAPPQHVIINDGTRVAPLVTPSTSSPTLANIQTMKADVMREVAIQHQDEFNATKRQFERDKSYLESELKDLQEKVLKMEESRTSSVSDYSQSIRELEAQVRKLELEREQLLISLDSLRERHKSEMNALEASHKTRIGFIEDSFKRREMQLIEEAKMEKGHYEEKLKALMDEKEDVLDGCRKKEELLEKNNVAEINRIKGLHEKAVEDLIHEHNKQLEHIKLMKDQEVAAAVSAFSSTKSLHALMQEVQDSTREVSNLQLKIDTAHKSKTDSDELKLKSRDEYLKNLQERLTQQEKSNTDERQYLQNLIAKMEIQLREETRQLEQDKWKLVQGENRLTTMQSAFEEEKRVMMDQIMQDRDQVAKAREEMLVDQRKIISECCEEKRKLENERATLSMLRSNNIASGDRSFARLTTDDLDSPLSRYHQETLVNDLKDEKEKVLRERKELEKAVAETQAAGQLMQQRSKEVEEFAVEAKRIHDEGIQACQAAECQRSELNDANKLLDVRLSFLQDFENNLKEQQTKLQVEHGVFQREREANKCLVCKSSIQQLGQQTFNTGHPMIAALPPNLSAYLPVVQSPPGSFNIKSANQLNSTMHDFRANPTALTPKYQPQPPSNVDGNNNIIDSTSNSLQTGMYTSDSLMASNPNLGASSESPSLPPPDLIMNSFEFKRAMRRYSQEKDQDDSFFEEETRFLKRLHEKRLR